MFFLTLMMLLMGSAKPQRRGTGGQTMSRIIQYTADDEEPECRNCDNQDGQKVCENCGPEYGWAGYIRSDLEIDENE